MDTNGMISTELAFAVLPIVLPINPRNGLILKKKDNGNNSHDSDEESDPSNTPPESFVDEINPYSRYVVREKLNTCIIENNNTGIYNNSGYYLFLNLPKTPIRQTIMISSHNFLPIANLIEFGQFDFDRKNSNDNPTDDTTIQTKSSPDRSIIVYLFEKKLLKNTDNKNLFINDIMVYPSKDTVLRVIIHKFEGFDTRGDPIKRSPKVINKVYLKKKFKNSAKDLSDKFEIMSIKEETTGVYVFDSLQKLNKIGTFVGSYDEHELPLVGERSFISFKGQYQGKFWIVIENGNDTENKKKIEIKIENGMTTSINILIID